MKIDPESVMKYHKDAEIEGICKFNGYVKKKDVIAVINKFNPDCKKKMMKEIKKL
jgi:hypothetical protein